MLIELKMWIIPVAALIPLIMGFIWYNPKLMQGAWMKEAGITEETMKGANMGMVYGLSYVFSCMMGLVLLGLSVHQMGFNSLVNEADDITMAAATAMKPLIIDNFRTFGHGSMHGFMAGMFFAFPLLAMNAMFERKSWKYIWINTGYWVISLALMGGVICQFA